ncbi:unnamed protein product [Microthlaspi erraticum]|uniref:F-box domain-containing protein n=1 Tax=Microthlaspi erraticum TaxID=1685480 RepID=A0A6D2JWB0_9BRAS|nr:unnamed protein product [Microthlaspi erraticum]
MSSIIRAEDEQSSEPPSLILSLLEDLIVDILARVPRFDYPKLSLVSKHIRSLVTSPYLYARRSSLRCTEHCIYVVLYNADSFKRWYILSRKPNGNRHLVLIPSLPAMCGGRCVAVGSRIYMFGGVNLENMHQRALSIDCRSHTVQTLPTMPISSVIAVAGIIDGKIYVIGNVSLCSTKVMVVFNTETQTWEPEMIDMDLLGPMWPGRVVVLGDKIYMRDYENTFVYEPKESKWETDEMFNYEKWENACVVEGVWYYYDWLEEKLRAYDPKKRCSGVVNGLELELLLKTKGSWSLETASYGGKLAIFFTKAVDVKTDEVWYAEITMERRKGGEIWGNVEWCGPVTDPGEVYLAEPLAVIV